MQKIFPGPKLRLTKKGVVLFSLKTLLLIGALFAFIRLPQKNQEREDSTLMSENVFALSSSLGHQVGKDLEEASTETSLFSASCDETATEEASQITALARDKRKELLSFFHENAKDPIVHELHEGKLQYKILRNGDGEDTVDLYSQPLVRYRGYYLDGKDFIPEQETIIELPEMMEGLKKGLIGMQKNEIRRLYIHPDLSEQKENDELLTFDVELIEIDAPPIQETNEPSLKDFITKDKEAVR